jgi:asparagine synthase (glutamine-hydrolysing)
MCGLVTIIAANPVLGLGELAGRMIELIAHRGPDGRGIAAFDQTGQVGSGDSAAIALAHCRLAIQDTTDAGHQPMGIADGRHWLSYNGEIYNFKNLRTELEEKGIRFNSGSDTEVLLHLLADQDKAALPRLDGQFAFCFYDRDANTLTLARDRFGIKPLYLWSPDPGALCIASEIKAFTAHPDWNPRLNTHRARDFLERGLLDHVPGETMFADVHQVIPGTAITINLNQWAREPTQMVARAPRPCETNTWFNLKKQPPPPESDIGSLLAQSVRSRLIADVPVGSCLSGGIDSSAIVALTAQALQETGSGTALESIHARATEPGLDERDHARTAAEAAGAMLHEVTPEGSELFDRLDELVWAQDEPFASPSIFAQYKVMEQAKSLGLKVMLDGQGADEQLAGYHAFFKAALAEYFSRANFVAAHIHAHTAKAAHGYGLIKQIAEALSTFAPPTVRTRLRRNRITSATDQSSGHSSGEKREDAESSRRVEEKSEGVDDRATDQSSGQCSHSPPPFPTGEGPESSRAEGVTVFPSPAPSGGGARVPEGGGGPEALTRGQVSGTTEPKNWLDPFDAMPHSPRTVRGLSLDQLTRGSLPMLLHWEDRNAMAFGIEARVPFLDHNLVAASLALPTGDKIRRGITKWALRQSMRNLVPDSILDRSDKVAFATPERSWLQSDPRWAGRLEDGLEAASPLLKPEAADRLRAMLTDNPDAPPYDNAVWRVICFGAWARRYSLYIF